MAAQAALLVLARATGMECRHGPCGPGDEQCGRADLPVASEPGFHLTDSSCGMNDPNGPVFDPVHGVAHLSYQKWIAAPQPLAFRPRVYGHFVSRNLTHWARMPVNLWNGLDVTNGNHTGYDNQAIFSGAATSIPGFAPDGDGLGVVHIYPGETYSPNYAPVTIGQAVPARYADDPLMTNLSKPAYNPIFNGVGIVKGQGDTSSAWRTTHGEWRFRVANQTVYGAASSAAVKLGQWYVIGKNEDFPLGSCPSFFPLPASTRGFEFESEYRRLSAMGKLPTHVAKINAGGASVGTYTEGRPRQLGTFRPTIGFEELYSCLEFPFRGNSRCTLVGSGYGQHLDASGRIWADNVRLSSSLTFLLWLLLSACSCFRMQQLGQLVRACKSQSNTRQLWLQILPHTKLSRRGPRWWQSVGRRQCRSIIVEEPSGSATGI